jgi:hypothetical protein
MLSGRCGNTATMKGHHLLEGRGLMGGKLPRSIWMWRIIHMAWVLDLWEIHLPWGAIDRDGWQEWP